MDSTIDQLNAPMSFAKKTFLSAGGLAILASLIKPGRWAHDVMTSKEVGKRILDAEGNITQKYKRIMNASNQQFNKELADVMNKRKDILDPNYSSIPKNHKKPNAFFHPIKRMSDKLERLTISVKDKAEKLMVEKGIDVSSIEGRRLLNQVNISKDRMEELADTTSDLISKRKEIGETLSSRHLKHIDTILPVIGATSVAGSLLGNKNKMEKKAGLLEELIKASKEKAKIFNTSATEANVGIEKKSSLSIQATKESQDKPKFLPRPNLIAGKPDYERKDQMQPVHETVDSNATKIANAIGIKSIHNGELHLEDGYKKKAGFTLPMLMALHKGIKEHPNKSFKVSRDGTITFVEKVASAVNSIFPKVSKEEIYNKEIQKQTKKVDKHKLLLANSEMAHQEKDTQLKQMKSAIKEVNKKLEHYRGKAIEHFTNQLDTEANAV